MDMKERVRFLRKNQTEAEKVLWSRLRNRKFHDHGFHKQKAYDEERRKILEGGGFKILRFMNNEILLETEKILEIIYSRLVFPSPVIGRGVGVRV